MTTNFQINGVDWDGYFVRRDIFTEGGIWAWGLNTYGGLGDRTIVHRSSPVLLTGSGGSWKFISGGEYVSAAIRSDGTLWMWGSNFVGQLGDGTTNNAKSSPVQVLGSSNNWSKVSQTGTWPATAGLRSDGSLWTWGYNHVGQLGTGNITHRSSPAQTLAGGTDWKDVSAGGYHMAAIKTNGTLWTWGSNVSGQLGDNNGIVHRSSPVQVVGTGTWKMVSAGGYHNIGLKTDGTAWGWGSNGGGKVGDGTYGGPYSSPVQVIGTGSWRTITTGFSSSGGIKTDGTLWLWGANTTGELGDGTVADKNSPVQTLALGRDWKQLTIMNTHSAAIKIDGTLWAWGRNAAGQLGSISNQTDVSSPVQILAGTTNWKMIAGGNQKTMAIREDFY